jgi:hypothetical protein
MGMGAVHYAAPLRGGVDTLMHVGHDGLGGIGPDFAGTARTMGWIGLALWGYSKFVSKNDEMAKKALPVAAAGFGMSFVL